MRRGHFGHLQFRLRVRKPTFQGPRQFPEGGPETGVIQSDGRIRRWARISGFENRALRVILLEDCETVPKAFFDLDYEEQQI